MGSLLMSLVYSGLLANEGFGGQLSKWLLNPLLASDLGYTRLMEKLLANGYSSLVLSEGQIDALTWLLNRAETTKLIDQLDPYVNESLTDDGYLGLKARIGRVQAKIDEQVGALSV